MEDISDWIGNTITYTADVKTTKPLSLYIYEYNGSNYINSRTNIPSNSEDTFTVTHNISTAAIALWIGIDFQTTQNYGEQFYTDNWRLIINS